MWPLLIFGSLHGSRSKKTLESIFNHEGGTQLFSAMAQNKAIQKSFQMIFLWQVQKNFRDLSGIQSKSRNQQNPDSVAYLPICLTC